MPLPVESLTRPVIATVVRAGLLIVSTGEVSSDGAGVGDGVADAAGVSGDDAGTASGVGSGEAEASGSGVGDGASGPVVASGLRRERQSKAMATAMAYG